VIIGSGRRAFIPFVHRGWDPTEMLSRHSVWRTIASSLFGGRYRTVPMSPLFVFGRPQDGALQKARATVDERNHLRVWLTPLRYQGLDVWIGQISRDIGVRLSSKTFVTHQIDPEVDDARYYLVQDLVLSGGVVKIGWVTGVGQAAISTPRFNDTGDPYYTDGIRVVLMMGEQHVPLGDIRFFPWGDPRHVMPQASRPAPRRLAGPHELSQLMPSATP
jgi:hypothetical protein